MIMYILYFDDQCPSTKVLNFLILIDKEEGLDMQSTSNKTMFCISKNFEFISTNSNFCGSNNKIIGSSLLEILNNFDFIKQTLIDCSSFNNFTQNFSLALYVKEKISSVSEPLGSVLYNDITNHYCSIWNNIEELRNRKKDYQEELNKYKKVLENNDLYDDFFNDLIEEQKNLISDLVDTDSIDYETELLNKYEDYLTWHNSGIDFIQVKIKENKEDIEKYDKEINMAFKELRSVNKYVSDLSNVLTQYKYYFDLCFGIIKKEDLKKKELAYFENLFGLDFELPSCHIHSGYMDKNTFYLLKDKNKSESSFNILNDLKKKQNLLYLKAYDILNVQDFFNVYLDYFINDSFVLRKCKNCGKYFIPSSRSDTKYCDNVSPQNSSKTCRDIGADLFYKEKRNSNPVTKAYSTARNTLSKRVSRCDKKDIKKLKKLTTQFDNLQIGYEKRYKKYEKGQLSEEEFIDWIISQKEI